MSVAMKLRELRWRAAGHFKPFGDEWTAPFEGAAALELGGPSPSFRSGGLLPVYPRLSRLDGVQVSRGHELWHGELVEGDFDSGEPGLTGRLWLQDGVELDRLTDASYDAVLSGHVLEHIANPVRALREWLRVLRPGGLFLIVLPHKEGCADHRRPTTTLEHMVEDERAGTGEDDLTHAEETIRLHDLARDPPAGDREALRERVLANADRRAMHHHVFTTPSALALLDHVGLDLVLTQTRWPHDIYALARKPRPGEPAPDNAALLAAATRGGPFRADRSFPSR